MTGQWERNGVLESINIVEKSTRYHYVCEIDRFYYVHINMCFNSNMRMTFNLSASV